MVLQHFLPFKRINGETWALAHYFPIYMYQKGNMDFSTLLSHLLASRYCCSIYMYYALENIVSHLPASIGKLGL